MNERTQILKTAAYLRARNGGVFELSKELIAKELLIQESTVSLLLTSGNLKSCHVDDVAEYINKKDNQWKR